MPDNVRDVMNHTSFIRTQADGAKVYVKQIQNTYNVIALSEETREVITALKNIDDRALSNLAKNYGWK